MIAEVLTYKEKTLVDTKNHPNLQYEKYFEPLEEIVELCNNPNDYVNLHYLNYNLYRKKFDNHDLMVLRELNKKYLPEL